MSSKKNSLNNFELEELEAITDEVIHYIRNCESMTLETRSRTLGLLKHVEDLLTKSLKRIRAEQLGLSIISNQSLSASSSESSLLQA
jgi:hypothetical protein